MSRKQYLAAKRGDLTSYAGMIGEEFSSKINRLSQILGNEHEASVGAYKEALLRECLRSFLPKKFNVGTGFVVFINESKLQKGENRTFDIMNLKEHSVSRQLDIIVFDDTNYPPIFRDKEFVIVRPESVRAIVEVKGFIRKSLVVSSIENFIDFGRKWNGYNEYCVRWGREKLHSPAIHLMAWDIYVDTNGKSDCDGEVLRKTIVETYREKLKGEELEWDKFPKLTAAYIYDDCVVNACGYAGDGKMGDGYSTNRGKFIRYDDLGQPHEDRDQTVSSLLASIHVNLDTPFNPDFSYLDQSNSTDIFPHKFQGITDWITGEDVKL